MKPFAIFATAIPILPRPITPRTLLFSWSPIYFFLSQAPPFRLLQAGTTFRLIERIKAIVCSAALRVLPPGVFITRIPFLVASGTSILSTPTPARAIAFSLPGLAKTLAVTFVPLRIISPSCSPIILANFSSSTPVLTTASTPSIELSKSIPCCASLSVIRTLITVKLQIIVPSYNFPGRCDFYGRQF